MGSVTRVPETATLRADELNGDDAWRALRRYGGFTLLKEAFSRFRYSDGFSHSRALALQMSLAAMPLMIVFVGLSRTFHDGTSGEVLRRTMIEVAPGSDSALTSAFASAATSGDRNELALFFGLVFATISLTTAMGQVERGANRIYGIERDRPTVRKYGRALVMAVVAGIPALVGVLLLLATNAFGDAIAVVYGVDDDRVSVVGLPLGAALICTSVTAMFRFAPRRRQPAPTWLVSGMVVTIALWLFFTGLFAGYLAVSDNFGRIYGPLTAVMVLLVWGQLSAMAVYFGLAFCAQLEAVRIGVRRGAEEDPEHGS
jgi:YihY family inner membrane protein